MVDRFVLYLKQYFTRTSTRWQFHGSSAANIPQLLVLDSYFVDYDFSPVGVNSAILREFEAIRSIVIGRPAPPTVESHDAVAKAFQRFSSAYGRSGKKHLAVQVNKTLAAGVGEISSFGSECGPDLLLNCIQQQRVDNVTRLFEVPASRPSSGVDLRHMLDQMFVIVDKALKAHARLRHRHE